MAGKANSFFNMQFITSSISTMLVLLLLGMVVFFTLSAKNLSDYVRENIGFTVLVSDDMKETEALNFQRLLNEKAYVKESMFISKEQALKEQTEAMGTDPAEFLGYNPFTASIEIKLNAEYANSDSIAWIEKEVKANKKVMEVSYPQAAPVEQIRDTIKKDVGLEAAVQNFGTARDVMIRLPILEGQNSGDKAKQVMEVLQKTEPGVQLTRVEFVGPQVGEELASDGATALLLVCIGIMIYLAFRFEWKFALAAIIANMHDVVLVVGVFSIFQWEFSLPVLAAVLAVLGYSVNESVIIFDRVREHIKKMRRASTVEVIYSAITATISRTMITHGSTLAMTLAMYFFGGPALHYFALALTIGICFGIYSSVFVSAAIAMYLGVKREDLIRQVKKDEVQELVP